MTGQIQSVALWIKSNCNFTRFTIPNSPDVMEYVCIALNSLKLIFLCAYIPPSQPVDTCIQISDFIVNICDHILSLHANYDICICADFNQFNVTQICTALDLVDIDSPPTLGLNRLDRFLCSANIAYRVNCAGGAPISDSDHSSLICTLIDCSRHTHNCKINTVYDLRPSFVNRFLVSLNNVNWDFIKSDLPVDVICTLFHDYISDCILNTIPLRSVPVSHKDKPWITSYIKHLIHERWNAYRSKNFARYNHLKIVVRKKIDEAKADWAKNIHKPDELWKKVNYINSSKNKMSLSNLISSAESIPHLANCINNIFCNNFSKLNCTNLLDSCNFPAVDSLWNIDINDTDVIDFLANYKSCKAFGPDLVPTVLYQKAAHIIAKPLADIFNLCVANCTFPSFWKLAHISPVPKCANPTIQQLRPISLLSLPSKMFESFIFKSVKHIFYCNFDDNQFGFRPNSSTTCALIKLHHHITKLCDNIAVKGVQLVALDYAKAFDCLDHCVIVRKLVDCKFPANFIKLIVSYLTNRKQAVRLCNVNSDWQNVSSGVPQGSILGPSLFSLVMSDLNCIDSSTCIVKFADDVTLSIPLYHSKNAVNLEIENVLNWSQSVGLNLNFKKCVYLLIPTSKDCKPVYIPNFALTSCIKLLGVLFTDNCKWDMHIQHISKIANQRAYALRVLKSFLTSKELIIVYNALVLSVMEYSSPLFVGLNDKNCKLLNSVQRRLHNIICNFNCKCNLFEDLDVRRINKATKLYFQIYNDKTHLLHSIIPIKRTYFIQPYSKTERFKASFIPYTTEHVNKFCINRN